MGENLYLDHQAMERRERFRPTATGIDDAVLADAGAAIRSHIKNSMVVLERAANDREFLRSLTEVAGAIIRAFRCGGKVLIAGNGGSAADAQHIAGEFLSRYRFDRPSLPALALTTDTSVLTAISNDYDYEHVFERQVRGLCHAGDVFIGISTSGRSPNVVSAVETARELGACTIGLTSIAPTAALLLQFCDIALIVPSEDTPLIQQVHITAAHAVCDVVERALFN
jgi:D-sedoheptulose 7-phosphate isomerase